MNKILVFGGGDIAIKGIAPIVDGCIVVPQSQCDVRSLGWVVSKIEEYRPTVVINCAGVSRVGSLDKAYSWEDEIDTNLKGSFNIAQGSVWRGVKTMIFIASVAGMYGKPEHASYCASKAGVISLVQSLGMEGHNAYAISPGRVDTTMRERDYPGENIATRLEPREIGQVVQDILDGKYEPGDNIVIRRIGYETVPIVVDQGQPWKEYLKVGQPKTL